MEPTLDLVPVGPRAFVCYSTKDVGVVDRVVKEISSSLEDLQLDVWYDRLKINAGDSVIREIAAGIGLCDYFLPILSEHSIKSRWVRFEIESALTGEVNADTPFVIPLIISGQIADVGPMLRAKRIADCRSDRFETGIGEVHGAIRRDWDCRFVVRSPVAAQFFRGEAGATTPVLREGDVLRENGVLGYALVGGTLRPVRSKIQGVIARLHFTNGDQVVAGQALYSVRVDDAQLKRKYRNYSKGRV